MSRLGQERLIESFAKKRNVAKENVALVTVNYKMTGAGVQVILGGPLTGAKTINSDDLGKTIIGPGKDFVLEEFETATGKTVNNGGKGWMIAVHDRQPGQPDGEVNVTYLIASDRYGYLSSYRR